MTKLLETKTGYFGDFGGIYVPEALKSVLEELALAYESQKNKKSFQDELEYYLKHYVGRPTPLFYAKRFSNYLGGGKIYLKREDLNHTGAHKINNTMGQILLAKILGKKRIIAETGAGQHGVATATVCSLLGLDCTIYMGKEDTKRQELNVFRMELLGAKVIAVEKGAATLKEAVDEALMDLVNNHENTFYLLGSAVGPHPYPTIVRDFQRVIGIEARRQFIELEGKLPDYLLACVGGGSNAIGLFHPFLADESVQLIGVEPAGHGLDTDKHSATLTKGSPGTIHGFKCYLLQDENGEPKEVHSIAAGLDYPGVGPEHSYLKDSGRASYETVTDQEALEAFKLLSRLEGIIPALESSHALAYACRLAKTLPASSTMIINLSGRGDKDVQQVANLFK